jgi:YD repeat-containing protein
MVAPPIRRPTRTTNGQGTTAYAWDDNENLTGKQDPNTDVTQYAYNFENRLTGILFASGATNSFKGGSAVLGKPKFGHSRSRPLSFPSLKNQERSFSRQKSKVANTASRPTGGCMRYFSGILPPEKPDPRRTFQGRSKTFGVGSRKKYTLGFLPECWKKHLRLSSKTGASASYKKSFRRNKKRACRN